MVKQGDMIRIDIPNRRIDVLVSEEELAKRRQEQDKLGWQPVEERPRKITAALKAYAKLATSADKGAVRDLSRFSIFKIFKNQKKPSLPGFLF